MSFKSIYENYEKYIEKKLSLPLLKHSQIKNLIESLREKNNVSVELAGYSIEGREIYSISLGEGNICVLAWSQMHGDEPTATATIFDLINFFLEDDEYKHEKEMILNKLKIFFIPMLNPDGAEKFQRENSLNIDLNRDAIRCESYESKILWDIANRIKPKFAFNLHDQNNYYTAGRSNNLAAISMLAPPSDFDKSITETRKISMKLIVKISEILKEFIPFNIARYDDDHEPRSFGDNFTKTGISSILIESGFLRDDPTKTKIRKLNFISLLSAFYFIATEKFNESNYLDYFSIPENNQLLFDLLLRNLKIKKNGNSFTVDIGINRERKYDSETNNFYFVGKIKEIGDLSIKFGIEEYILDGYNVDVTKIYSASEQMDFEKLQYKSLLSAGYGYIRFNNKFTKDYINLPINMLCYDNYKPQLAVDEYANLIISKGKDKTYIVINGFFQILNDSETRILNSLIIH